MSSSGSLININDPLSISIAGASGTSVGNIARFNSGGTQIDFNHQGDLSGSFFIYDSRAQQSGIDYPFEVSFSNNNEVKINGQKFPSDDGSAGQVLTTNGSNVLSWSSNGGLGSFSSQSLTVVPNASAGSGAGHNNVRFITTGGGTTGLSISQPGLNSTERMTFFVRNNGTNGTLTVSFTGDTYTSGTMTVGQGKVRMFNAYAMQDDIGATRIFVEASQSDVTYP